MSGQEIERKFLVEKGDDYSKEAFVKINFPVTTVIIYV